MLRQVSGFFSRIRATQQAEEHPEPRGAPAAATHVRPAATPYDEAVQEGRDAPHEGSADQAKARLLPISRANKQQGQTSAGDLTSINWEERRAAVFNLLHQDAHLAVPQLILMLEDPDNQVRIAAVKTLAQLGTPKALGGLFHALGDEDYLVCDAASDALASVGRLAVQHLLKAVQQGSVNTRGAAIEALEKIGDPAAVPVLAACLDDQECPWLANLRICDLAARALNGIGGEVAQEMLRAWYAENPHERARQRSLIGGRGGGSPAEQGHRLILDEILGGLRHEVWSVRQDAAKALRDYARFLKGEENPAQFQQLLAAFDDADWVVRWSVAEALALLAIPLTVPVLVDHLDDPIWQVRLSSARALQEIGDSWAVASLIKALCDSHKLVRQAAAEALGCLKDASAVPALAGAAGDVEEFVRLAAVNALGELGGPQAGRVLLDLLENGDQNEIAMRWACLRALGKIADTAAIMAVAACLDDKRAPFGEELRICDVAAETLQQIGTTESLVMVEQWQTKYARV